MAITTPVDQLSDAELIEQANKMLSAASKSAASASAQSMAGRRFDALADEMIRRIKSDTATRAYA